MSLKHLSYSSNGHNFQVLKDEKPTGQLCYKSQIGQENILEQGSYVPYIKDETAKTLTFKRSRIKLTATGIEFYIWDKDVKDYILRTTASFHPEIKESETWNRKISTAKNIVWEEIVSDGVTDTAKVSYILSTGNMDVKVGVEVGGSSKALFSFELTSKVAAKQRLVWHTDELEEAVLIEAKFDTSKGKQTRTVGYSFTGYEIRWDYQEAVERKVEGIAVGEETKIIIAEKSYVPGQVSKIRPDTWGETGIANTNDDCSEGQTSGVDLDGGDADGAPCGSCDWFGSAEDWDYSARFQNVTIPANSSVETGTQIEFDVGYSDGSFTPVCYGLEGDTPAFNVSAPSTRTRTTSSCSFTQPTVGVDRVVSGTDFQAVIKEILDSVWSSGYDLGITFDNGDSSGISTAFQVEDYSTGTAARLTIVYTLCEVKKPTAYTEGALALWSNESGAYDISAGGDETTYASCAAAGDEAPSIRYHTWGTKGQTYTSTILRVKWSVPVTAGDDLWDIEYTKDGGSNWLTLLASGTNRSASIVTTQVSLDANQDLTNVEIRINIEQLKGSDSHTIRIYDVWTEGEYTASSNVNVEATSVSLSLVTYSATVNAKINVSATCAQLSIVTYQATVNAETNIEAVTGALVLATQGATVNAEISIQAITKALSLVVHNATVDIGGAVNVDAGVVNLTLAAQLADVNLDISIQANISALNIATFQATINAETSVDANTETLSLATQGATVNAEIDVQAITEMLSLVIYNATVDISGEVNVSCNTATLSLVGAAAAIKADISIQASEETLTLTTFAAVINAEVNIQAGVEVLSLVNHNATVDVGGAVNVDCATATLSLTEIAASIKADINIGANIAALVLSTQNATVSVDATVFTAAQIAAIKQIIRQQVRNAMGIHDVQLGDEVALVYCLTDGATDQYPQVEVRDNDGNALATVDLSYEADGVYVPVTPYTMPNEDFIRVLYIVYSDVGHTVENTDYAKGVDVFYQADLNAIADTVLDRTA